MPIANAFKSPTHPNLHSEGTMDAECGQCKRNGDFSQLVRACAGRRKMPPTVDLP